MDSNQRLATECTIVTDPDVDWWRVQIIYW